MNSAPIGVAILGCGVVGSGLVRLLTESGSEVARRVGLPLAIRGIAVAHPERRRPEWVEPSLICGDAAALVARDDVLIVAECIGGTGQARQYVEAALRAGKHVATANKELMAKHGHDLCQIADDNGVALRYEGSVAGGIPLIGPVRTSLAADRIERILGILNGTTNYILTRMTRDGMGFEEALELAQELGFAEMDPTDDVDGFDAAYKLNIVASIGFGRSLRLGEMHREGIRAVTAVDIAVAERLGYVIKLLAIAKRDEEERLELRVHPTLVPKDHPLASVSDEFNAVFINLRHAKEVMFYGPGAGLGPTGSAVAGDIVDIARDVVSGARARIRCTCQPHPEVRPIEEIRTRYYLRLLTRDRTGVLGGIALILGEYDVGIATVSQELLAEDDPASHGYTGPCSQIVIVTHPARERNLRRALREIDRLPAVHAIASTFRVEE
ncbi:MAG: homoserine dehydrogenase [candidate division WS1 bacterium]|nr:homoserine dehydrogenase [candidate division WS1 bacterium]